MSFRYNEDLFEKIKFDVDNLKELKSLLTLDLNLIANQYNVNLNTVIKETLNYSKKKIKDSKMSVYDIIVMLKESATNEEYYYRSRNNFVVNIREENRQVIINAVNKNFKVIKTKTISNTIIEALQQLIACELLLEYENIDSTALNLEVSLKQFQNILNDVSNSSTGDFNYRSNLIASYGTTSEVVINLTAIEKAKLQDPKVNSFHVNNTRDVSVIIKKDWYETVKQRELTSIELNNGKVAAVLEAEEVNHKTKEDTVDLFKLKVLYVKVPNNIQLWRNSSKENFEKCIFVEDLYFAKDTTDTTRFATGTTPGRAIGTLNRRAKKDMFDLMGI